MWQYSFHHVTSWLGLSWLAGLLEKHVTGIKSLWMLMCSSFEPQRILILLPSSTNSCTVFSYLTEQNKIAWHDWPECKYCCLQQLMAFCRNLTNQVISSPAAEMSAQASRNLFLNNVVIKTVKLIYHFIKKMNTLYIESTQYWNVSSERACMCVHKYTCIYNSTIIKKQVKANSSVQSWLHHRHLESYIKTRNTSLPYM